MKKYILLFGLGLSLLVNSSTAQTVNGIPLADIDTRYIELGIEYFSLKNYVEVIIDYGQAVKQPRNQYRSLLDENGKPLRFNSSIDVINFMYEQGYELTCNYDGQEPGNLFRFYVLKRRIE
ncbi:MAG: hypothetical protein AAGC85_15995 [Bacteroidota bacterium]